MLRLVFICASVSETGWRWAVWFIGIASLTGTLLFARNLLTMLVGPLVGYD